MDIKEFVRLAIQEDIRDADHSANACIDPNQRGKAQLLIKENGIIAGIDVAKQIFRQFDPTCIFNQKLSDGQIVNKGDVAFFVELNAIQLLSCERLVLNVMQRMSAIATLTKKYAQKIEDLPTNILDTRKTTPLIRFLEKEAVKIGGGMNHRMGLYDMIMIKDNHIDVNGSIENAILKTKQYLEDNKLCLQVEIETRDLDEVQQVLDVGNVNRIMLDNFSYEDLKTAVKMINNQFETEASGGITIENVRDYALCGVDFISSGELTHSIKNLDLSLKVVI